MGASGGGIMDIVGAPFEAIGLDPTGIPIIGGMFGNSPAEDAQLAQMRQAAQNYKNMRAPQAEARSAALGNTLEGIGGGGNALMDRVYGPGMGMDFQQAAQNPISQEMLEVGNPSGPPGGMAPSQGFQDAYSSLTGRDYMPPGGLLGD